MGLSKKVVEKACVNATTKARRELRDRDRWRSATDTFLSKNTVSSSFRFGADLFMEHTLKPLSVRNSKHVVSHSLSRTELRTMAQIPQYVAHLNTRNR